MLIGPMLSADNAEKGMVEPPGIAPGSSPLIARAFISIVRTDPDPPYIGEMGCRLKNNGAKRFAKRERKAYFASGQVRCAGGLGPQRSRD